jgi:hypothetical protein
VDDLAGHFGTALELRLVMQVFDADGQ